MAIPKDWVFVGQGHPALRRLLAAGPGWRVVSENRNSRFTTGIWVPPKRLDLGTSQPKNSLLAERVFALLDFPKRHQDLARGLSTQIAGHLSQQALPDEGRSLSNKDLELALLLWLEQHVEAETGRQSSRSRPRERWHARALAILAEYRIGLPRSPELCPLTRALALASEAC